MTNYLLILRVSLFLLCLDTGNILKAQCNAAAYSTNEKDSWLSCQVSANPNSIRGNSHWLRYDLGYVYGLRTTKFWNYNVANFTDKGFKQIAIDYSLDGVNWTEAGTFQLPEAAGNADFEGTNGLDLSGITARYLIITALSNWNNGNCAGLSEVRFEVHQPNTNCGDYLVTENIGGNAIKGGSYYANNTIQSDGIIKSGTSVTFQSATAITLKAGFMVEAGSQFLAKIENCTALDNLETSSHARQTVASQSTNPSNLEDIKVYPNPTVNLLNIDFGAIEIRELMIINVSGHEILRRTNRQNLNQIDVASLPSGMYLLTILTTDQQIITKRFIKAGL